MAKNATFSTNQVSLFSAVLKVTLGTGVHHESWKNEKKKCEKAVTENKTTRNKVVCKCWKHLS